MLRGNYGNIKTIIMKPKAKILTVFLMFFISMYSVMGQFMLQEPSTISYGNIGRGQTMTFTFTVQQIETEYHTYQVSILDQNNSSPFLTISPSVFALEFGGATQVVTFTGVIPSNWEFDDYVIMVDFKDVNDPNQFAYGIVFYEVSTLGIEDNISITQYNSLFSSGDLLHSHAVFGDEYPYGDHMTGWNMEMDVFPSGETFNYASQYSLEGPFYTDFYLTAGNLPSNGPFVRNENGQVLGSLKIWGYDNNGYLHEDKRWFGIYKEPDPAFLSQRQMNGNSIHLYFKGMGATSYYINYATHSGPPYNGTGATQGSSPINVGGATDFIISGLQPCTPYYFSVVGVNNQGNSIYSSESRLIFFQPANQQSVDYFMDEVVIEHDFSYSTNMYFAKNLIVESGHTLTVNNCILYFESNAKIVIKPGAKLIINGATFTSPCNQSWPGIEVWGNYNQHQYTNNGNCQQGKLSINPGSVIENAYNIAMWKPGDYSTSGGIIQATGATFKNNRRAIEFISYHNFNPYSSPPYTQTNNLSYFNNCTFTTDGSYLITNPFYAFITMWDVEGIRINGCNFSNLVPISTNTNRGNGIYSIDAGYIVGSYCSNNAVPCPVSNTIPSVFQNLNHGIYALSQGSLNTISVSQSQFLANGYGIRLNAVNNATIVKDTFDIGPNTVCPNFTGIGVEINKCTGYQVEENNFKHTGNTNQGDNYVGIRIIGEDNTSQVTYNEIYKNVFHDINIGNQAEQMNYNPGIPTGLCYYCNKNYNNIFDFRILDYGISQYQGSYNFPAGNIFSKNFNNPYSDFNNQAVWSIIYRYYSGDLRQHPDNIFNVSPLPTPNTNACASHIGGNGSGIDGLTSEEIETIEQAVALNDESYQSVMDVFKNLKDGGRTSDLSIDIATSSSSQMMTLRDELLGSSPHLSQEILKAAADKTEVLPDPILFEILAANPDELRNSNLLDYLATKENPLPSYMIDLLSTMAADTTYKTTLQSEMSFLKGEGIRASNKLIRNILRDTTRDFANLRTWLDNQQNISADYQMIDSWLQEKNTENALALINLLPQLYAFDSSATTEYNYYKSLKTFQAQLINEGINIFNLDSNQISFLHEIATLSIGLAGLQASNILEFGYGEPVINCPPSQQRAIRDRSSTSYNTFLSSDEPKISVWPNPANNWAVFTYSFINQVSDSYIEILNLNNRKIRVIKLNNSNGQVIIDTRNLNSGVYIYVIKSGTYAKTGKLSVMH